MNEKLVWKEESRRSVYSCPIFSVTERTCRSPEDKLNVFTVLETMDWAIVIPVLKSGADNKFVMVRQWRHGAKALSLEFPGGVFEKGEAGEEAARRELLEETGFSAGRITKLGDFNPNPAIMSNTVHFYLAEELTGEGLQKLDEDEYVNVEVVLADDVFAGIGNPPYIHALMGTALSLFYKYQKKGA